ncbi:MAG: hypothetical protein L0Z53_05740, partial [Acidobacteriales bacterium]|nr:hypothetical protein [Terriglobales bacterium]
LDADVLVAPGAVTEIAGQSTPADAALPASVEPGEPRESWPSEQSREARETLRYWHRRASEIFAVASHRLTDGSRVLRNTGLARAKHWLARAAVSSHQSWHFLRQTVNQRAAGIHAKLQQARARAAERARMRAVEAEQRVQSRQQEKERYVHQSASVLRQREEGAALEAARQQVLEQQAPAATESSGAVVADSEETAAYTAPSVLRKSAQRRSPLVAYTRNRTRDWKMAFLGAAAASAVVLIISLGVVRKPLPTTEPKQPLPFGATAHPQPPTLMIPAAVTPPVRPPVVVKKTTPPMPKPPLTVAPETEPTDDEYFEEVVVRHYRAQESAKAHTGPDGVKRISDLD